MCLVLIIINISFCCLQFKVQLRQLRLVSSDRANEGCKRMSFWKKITIQSKIMYLLTEWEGRTGKYLARGHGVRTERSDLTYILLYDHRAFAFSIFFFYG